MDPETADQAERHRRLEALTERLEGADDPRRRKMPRVMRSFAPGLFVGPSPLEAWRDNLGLERWFRLPTSPERRLHGRRHAGVRIVPEGPTLAHALDAHAAPPAPFAAADLRRYRQAPAPPCPPQAFARRKIMRKARSPKRRSTLLADLERRYREIPRH